MLSGGASGSAASQAVEAQVAASEWRLPGSVVLRFRSRLNGVDYELLIRPPTESAGGPHPAIVTLDADYSFPIAAAHLEHLAARGGQGPAALLVSIAYAGDYPDGRNYRLNRTRDYTPYPVADGGYGPEYQARSGGAPVFLRVLTEEALPLVQSRWATRPDLTLVGHSFGGLFAAWVLQNHPEAFHRYLMVSPSLWYADEAILKREAQGGLAPLAGLTRVYLGVGGLEGLPGGGGHPMQAQLRRFADQLSARGDPNLLVRSRIFEDETHASIFPACFSTGIRHLFAMT